MPDFDIKAWRAWSPLLPDSSDWQRWAHDPAYRTSAAAAAPDVSFLPAMQRRRLGLLARLFFTVAHPLVDLARPLPVVFASRHGETRQTVELLSALDSEAGLSPTAFGLSVHNAPLGQWSILTGWTTEMVATANGGDRLEHALLEACGLLQSAAQVLVVCAEDQPAPEYGPWIDDVPFPFAAAWLIEPGDRCSLTLGLAGDTDPGPAPEPASPLALLRALLLGRDRWSTVDGDRRWHWRH